MSTIALAQLIQGAPAFFHGLVRRFAAFLEGIGEARAMAETFKSLSRMSDEELARRGLRREEIPQAVLASRGH